MVAEPLRLGLAEGAFDTVQFDSPNPWARKSRSFDQPAEALMKDVRFGTPSPQQKLQKLAALFGANSPDPCESEESHRERERINGQEWPPRRPCGRQAFPTKFNQIELGVDRCDLML